MADEKPREQPTVPEARSDEVRPAEGETAAVDPESLRMQIVDALKTVYDPEIPVDIWELGLIYDLQVAPDGTVDIKMTLTAPACPAAEILPGEVEQRVREVPGVKDVRLELVWDPPWDKDRMSEAARLQLGFL